MFYWLYLTFASSGYVPILNLLKYQTTRTGLAIVTAQLVVVLLASFLGSAVLAVLLSRLPVVSALLGVKRRERLEVGDALGEPSSVYDADDEKDKRNPSRNEPPW